MNFSFIENGKITRIFIILLAFLTGCTSLSADNTKIKLLSSRIIETGTELDGFPVGGLSEISVSHGTKFIALSDARSTKKEGPSRFYIGKFVFRNGIMEDLIIKRTVVLKKADGKGFGAKERDPESFILEGENDMLYTSEGNNVFERVNLDTGVVNQSPDRFLPSYYYGKQGLRRNQGIEGMSLIPDGTTLFIVSESALIRDGNVATLDNPAVSRILKLKKKGANDYEVIGEYAYSVSKIPVRSEYDIQDNGVSAILALDDSRLIMVERNGYAIQEGYSHFDFNVRLFLVDLSEATNFQGKKDIPNGTAFAKKRLLINLSDLVKTPDNVEGISWGPDIKDYKSIILVSDNNFAKHQANRFYQVAVPMKQIYPSK